MQLFRETEQPKCNLIILSVEGNAFLINLLETLTIS